MSLTNEKPVIIVGAGPVGLSLALMLIRQGITVEVFEALSELSDEARASTFQPRTLEMFDELNIVEQVLQQGYKVDQIRYWERETRKLVAEFNYDLISSDTAFPFRLQLPQCDFTRVVKPLIDASPLGRIHMAHQLTSFEDTGSSVKATFDSPDGEKTVEGSYLCGADGSRSTVRQQLALPFEGMTYEDRFMLVATDMNLRQYFENIGPVNYLYDPDEWVIILHLPDVVRIVFKIQDHEDEEDVQQETAVRERVARFLGQTTDFNIKGVRIYKVHQRVADTFRTGTYITSR